ncbi:MAG: lytic transglycosylase domain-containing protein [Clostridiales bacterium]|nr:lytic transglycosylase domain-containing protein [Clostridiales bacterium]
MYPIKYQETVEKYSAMYDVEPELILAVINTESGFNRYAVSSANAMGLMQITPETFSWLQTKFKEKLSEDALFEEDTAIRYGTYFLHILLEEFEDTDTALAAYHAGMNKVKQWLKDKDVSPDGKTLSSIPYNDTAYYVHKIEKAVDVYRKIYKPEAAGTTV